jgi:hypothetical protein
MGDFLKPETYKHMKILGIVLFIPFAVGVGPLTGLFIGMYLAKKFSLGISIVFIFVTLGCLSGLLETIRLVKFMIKESQK